MHVWQEERPAGILSWVSVSTENCVFVRSQHLSFPVSMSWLFSWLQHQSIEALKATRPSRKWQTAEETCSDCFKYTLFTVCCSQPCHVAATYPPPPQCEIHKNAHRDVKVTHGVPDGIPLTSFPISNMTGMTAVMVMKTQVFLTSAQPPLLGRLSPRTQAKVLGDLWESHLGPAAFPQSAWNHMTLSIVR